MTTIQLSLLDLALASLTLVGLGLLGIRQQMEITRALWVAGVRMALQLMLLGLVLKSLFRAEGWIWVALMSLIMLLAAGREVTARQKRPLKGFWNLGTGLSSMFVSSFALALFGLIVVVEPSPWYQPQYAIPILGMLLGNTMNGVALVMNQLSNGAWDRRHQIEQQLMLGCSGEEAIQDLAKEAVRTAMMPVINSMAVAGIVSLPGMMTGQILAGHSPNEAVKYQIFIWFLIGAGSGFGILLASGLVTRRLFDERDRLRLDRLRPKNG